MAVLARFLHIAGMALVAAGMLYVRLGLAPPAADADERDLGWIARVAPAWRAAVWVALAAGVYNLAHLRPGPAPGLRGLYVGGLVAKLTLVTALFTLVFALTERRPRPWFWQRRRRLLGLGVLMAAAVIAVSAFLRSLR